MISPVGARFTSSILKTTSSNTLLTPPVTWKKIAIGFSVFGCSTKSYEGVHTKV